jgi:4-aminobutyrate aminotransferase-like enzyme
MEFFNTFGGNPVSCATAAAVLGVVEEERLRENVCAAGDVLISGLRDLAARSDRIGDVRGVGLFVGFVLVKGAGSDAPDAALASEVVECARGRGVLLSTDGPLHDVIKIKPPIVFTPDDSAHLIAVIESSLLEAVSRLESC